MTLITTWTLLTNGHSSGRCVLILTRPSKLSKLPFHINLTLFRPGFFRTSQAGGVLLEHPHHKMWCFSAILIKLGIIIVQHEFYNLKEIYVQWRHHWRHDDLMTSSKLLIFPKIPCIIKIPIEWVLEGIFSFRFDF